MAKQTGKVKVVRLRCNGCSKNVTIISTSKKKFKEGEGMGISCADLKFVYDSLEGCNKELVFSREQGERERTERDTCLEDLPDLIETAKIGKGDEDINPIEGEE
jgi:hypothetical protein